ncbi:MAG: signal peptidase II [Aestuariivirga sp.]|jgi:signal peptidase II
MTRFWSPLAPLGLAVAALAFGMDQSVKWWLLNIVNMPDVRQIAITPFFDVVMAWNKGVSYGLMTTHVQPLLIGISVLISAVLWLWACRSPRPLTVSALGLVIGGALGNAMDRAVHGAVADFFLFHWRDWNWYVFNPADVAIFAGVALLLYESWGERKA